MFDDAVPTGKAKCSELAVSVDDFSARQVNLTRLENISHARERRRLLEYRSTGAFDDRDTPFTQPRRNGSKCRVVAWTALHTRCAMAFQSNLTKIAERWRNG